MFQYFVYICAKMKVMLLIINNLNYSAYVLDTGTCKQPR